MNLDTLIEHAERGAETATPRDMAVLAALYEAKALESIAQSLNDQTGDTALALQSIAQSLKSIEVSLERLPFPLREQR